MINMNPFDDLDPNDPWAKPAEGEDDMDGMTIKNADGEDEKEAVDDDEEGMKSEDDEEAI